MDKLPWFDEAITALFLDFEEATVLLHLGKRWRAGHLQPIQFPYFGFFKSLAETLSLSEKQVTSALSQLSRHGYISWTINKDESNLIDIELDCIRRDCHLSLRAQDAALSPVGAKAGVIYLIQAGPHYKIGKTSNPDSRLTQLSIQLPHKPVLIHSIKTNDIHRLEKHWHRHFSNKRANGEWFELSEIDVAEFRALSVVVMCSDE